MKRRSTHGGAPVATSIILSPVCVCVGRWVDESDCVVLVVDGVVSKEQNGIPKEQRRRT